MILEIRLWNSPPRSAGSSAPSKKAFDLMMRVNGNVNTGNVAAVTV